MDTIGLQKFDADVLLLLPDHVISLILSFLPFPEAARTSVLSKKWRHLWRETGRIEFDESLFSRRGHSREDFMEFVRQWIRRSKETAVETFRLSVTDPGEYGTEVANCLRFAILRRAKRLCLDFSDPSWEDEELDPHQELPAFVYNHKLLESLKLFSCRFNVSEFRAFSALKDLSVGWIGVPRNSLKSLLVNCPLLESLCLKNCWNLGDPDISGPNLNLRRLIIDKCRIDLQITLMAKNLQYFKYSGTVISFYLEDQPEVKEVELDFVSESEFDNSGFSGDILQDALLYLYPNTLTVCSVMLQISCDYHLKELPTGEEPLRLYPYLKDLRHLILKTSLHSNELWGIALMLRSCPGLQKLTIDLVGPASIFHDYVPPFMLEDYLFWPVHAPFLECVREKLKVVEVNGFVGEPNVMQLLQNLIGYGCVMEVMSINLRKSGGCSEPPMHQCWTHMFQYFPRASQTLQFVIS